MGQYSIRNELAVRDSLQRACSRQEILILATPFMRFESSLLGLTAEELHAVQSMSPEEAIYGLNAPQLQMRFPHGVGFLEAGTHFRGLGTFNGTPTLRLDIPKLMEDDDQRGAYRAEPIEPLQLTFRDSGGRMRPGSLLNISATGVKLRAEQAIGELGLVVGSETKCQLPLTPELTLSGSALVRYTREMDMGIEFLPALPPKDMEPLNRWIFRRREEEKERKAKLDREALEGPNPEVRKVECLLLVSADSSLETKLRADLQGLPPIVRAEPNPTSMKAALDFHPTLLFLHLGEESPDARVRVALLAEHLGGRWPIVLLGTGVDNATLFELSQSLKPVGTFLLTDHGSTFFPRLVRGILRHLEEASWLKA